MHKKRSDWTGLQQVYFLMDQHWFYYEAGLDPTYYYFKEYVS